MYIIDFSRKKVIIFSTVVISYVHYTELRSETTYRKKDLLLPSNSIYPTPAVSYMRIKYFYPLFIGFF